MWRQMKIKSGTYNDDDNNNNNDNNDDNNDDNKWLVTIIKSRI